MEQKMDDFQADEELKNVRGKKYSIPGSLLIADEEGGEESIFDRDF